MWYKCFNTQLIVLALVSLACLSRSSHVLNDLDVHPQHHKLHLESCNFLDLLNARSPGDASKVASSLPCLPFVLAPKSASLQPYAMLLSVGTAAWFFGALSLAALAAVPIAFPI